MIRLLRDLGSLPAGAVTDQFEAAAEAAFLLDGTAEPAGAPRAARPTGAGGAAPDYSKMRKDELAKLAAARGLEVSPRAKAAELVAALEQDDGDA